MMNMKWRAVNQKKEFKLINNGAVGCIFRPNLTCSGNLGSLKYITKIQKNKRTIKHELRISDKVKKIRGYTRFFAPVLKYCPVHIKKDIANNLKKCEIFENESINQIESSSYVSMKTRYVGNKDLRDYIFSNNTYQTFLTNMLKTNCYLLKALHKLFENKIVHYDLKSNNIMFDSDLNVPIIIDFGQSWCINELNTEEKLSSAFFVFEEYDYWCIDVIICNYIIQKIGYKEATIGLVTEEEINLIYDVFIYGRYPNYDSYEDGDKKRTMNGSFLYNILQNPTKMHTFKNVVLEYLQPFINKFTWWQLYEELFKYANTWDCFSLSVIYLFFLDDAYLSNSEIYNTFVEISGIKLQTYVELLESVVYSAPNKRPTAKMVLTSLESIMKLKSHNT